MVGAAPILFQYPNHSSFQNKRDPTIENNLSLSAAAFSPGGLAASDNSIDSVD
jgi:hypothetical protein